MSSGGFPERLPGGLLLAWCGDDFTGSAAVMEVLSFAGLPARLFLDMPTEEQLARAGHLRAFGVASTARTFAPAQMCAFLPGMFRTLRALGAPMLHYKVCSTLDSSEVMGSIGCAAEIGLDISGSAWAPVMIAAPPMGRYQAFGNLFAEAFGEIHRLDRHPVMRRHPVTPIHEADVARHLARQTSMPLGCLTLADYAYADRALERLTAKARLITLDAVGPESVAQCGELLWRQRHHAPFVIGSQGIEYALLAHWRAQGELPAAQPAPSAGRADAMVVVSGSVSSLTQRQIDWALAHGFEGIALDAAALLDDASAHSSEAAAVAAALAALGRGRDPLIYTARGPDDPAVGRFRDQVIRQGFQKASANERVGMALGRILTRVVAQAGLRRAVISGGDTSGHATRELGIVALEPLAPPVPGAPICVAISHNCFNGLQLALKGGQMGSEDYFGWVRDGGGPHPGREA